MKEFFENVAKWFENNWQPIVTTLAIIIFGILLVRIILAVIKRQLSKTKLEKTIQSFICSISKFILYLVLVFCIISSLGISITGLTVVLSAISLAISLALQDSLKNLVNGFVIISTGVLKQGDWVQIGSQEGSVLDVKMLYTVLKTADNKKIYIPNTSVLSNSITNFNTLKFRRLDLNFNISYNSNVDKAKQVIMNVVNACENVYKDPAPTVVLSELGASSLTLTLKVWCGSSDYWDTKWFLIDNIFNELKRNKIKIPFNQLEISFAKDDNDDSQTYVRKDLIVETAEHKAKPTDEGDILSSINKSFTTKVQEIVKNTKEKRQAKKQSKKAKLEAETEEKDEKENN